MMPDASKECEIILEQLREIRDMHIEHATAVKVEIKHIKESLQRIEAIEASIDEMKIGDARQAGQIDGATWALAKVGAVCMASLGVIGWLVSGGWERLKDHLLK